MKTIQVVEYETNEGKKTATLENPYELSKGKLLKALNLPAGARIIKVTNIKPASK